MFNRLQKEGKRCRFTLPEFFQGKQSISGYRLYCCWVLNGAKNSHVGLHYAAFGQTRTLLSMP